MKRVNGMNLIYIRAKIYDSQQEMEKQLIPLRTRRDQLLATIQEQENGNPLRSMNERMLQTVNAQLEEIERNHALISKRLDDMDQQIKEGSGN